MPNASTRSLTPSSIRSPLEERKHAHSLRESEDAANASPARADLWRDANGPCAFRRAAYSRARLTARCGQPEHAAAEEQPSAGDERDGRDSCLLRGIVANALRTS